MGLQDTTQNGLSDSLSGFGRERFTGCVYIVDKANSQTGRIYFREGNVYAAQVDGFLPRIARRLRTAGVLSQDSYASVVAAHGGDDTDPGLGATVVGEGLSDQDTLDALNREFVLSAIGAILGWPDAKVKTTNADSTDLFLIKPVSVEKAINAIVKRQEYGGNLWQEIGGGNVVGSTVLARTVKPRVPSGEPTPDLDAFYSFIDGQHTLDQIAGELGLTRFEAVHMLHTLIGEGTVSVPKDDAPLSRSAADPQTASVPAYEVGTHTLLVVPDTGFGADFNARRIESDSTLSVPDFWTVQEPVDEGEVSSVFGGAPAASEEEPAYEASADGIAVPAAAAIVVDEAVVSAEAQAEDVASGWEDVAPEDAQAEAQDEEVEREWEAALAAVAVDEPVASREHDESYGLDPASVEWQNDADVEAADVVAAHEWVEAVDVVAEPAVEQAVESVAEYVTPVGEAPVVMDENLPVEDEALVAEEVVDFPADVVDDESDEFAALDTLVEQHEHDVAEVEVADVVVAEVEIADVTDLAEPVSEFVESVVEADDVEAVSEYVAPTIEAPEVLEIVEIADELEDVVEFTPQHAPIVDEAVVDEEPVLLAAAPAPDPSALINMPAPADPYAEQRAREAAEREERRRLLTQSLTAVEETLRRQEDRHSGLRSEVEQALAMKTTLNNALSDAQMLHSQTKHAYDQAQEVFRQAEEVYTQVERDLAAADARRSSAVTRLGSAQDAVSATNTAREQAEAAVRAAHEEFLRRVNAYNQTVVEYEAASREVNEADSFFRQVEQALETVKPQRDMYYQQYGAALRGTETAQARLESAEQDYSRAQATYEEVRREFREVEDEVRGLRSELQDVRGLLADLDD